MEYGYEAFDSTMEEMHDRFPGLEYDGYIAFTASDVHGGEGHQHEVSSVRKDNNKRTFDFIGEALRKILESEEYVPDEPEEAEGLKVVITGKLQYFENRDEITEYIKELSVYAGIFLPFFLITSGCSMVYSSERLFRKRFA